MLGGVTPGRRAPFLTPERVQQRFDTLLDAFQTADRRQRGYLPYDRVVAIYSLYFNASVGKLDDNELDVGSLGAHSSKPQSCTPCVSKGA